MSAYMLWLNSSRERIKSENPGISITEISKKAGEMWRQLGKEEKEARLADYWLRKQLLFTCVFILHWFKTIWWRSVEQLLMELKEVFCFFPNVPLYGLVSCWYWFFFHSFAASHPRNGKWRQERRKRSMKKQRRSTKRVAGCPPPLPRSKRLIRD